MVRARKGGPVPATPGQAYGNRTDLPGGVQAVEAARGQPYGARAAQVAGQKVIPLPDVRPGAAPAAPRGAPPGAAAAPGPLAAAGAGGGGQVLAMPGPFNRPTERPNEPVTAGAPSGPGPGPEVLGTQVDPLVTAAAALNLLGEKADPSTDRLRRMVNAQLANARSLRQSVPIAAGPGLPR